MNEKNRKKIFKNVILPIENVSYIERCSDGTKEESPYIYKNFLHKGKAVHLSERNTSRKGARYAHKMEENLYYQLFLEKEKNILERMKRCFRTNGHLESCVNPIELKKNVENRIKDLFLKKLKNLSMTRIYRRKVFNNRLDKLKKSILHMNQVYCSSIGVEYMHIEDKIQRDWIQKRLEERVCLKNTFDFSEKVRFLSDLIAAEELERYLEIRYPGEKRFSLEGIDVLIPMLKDMIIFSGNKKVDRIILGMTHRGRINVLANIFGKPLNKIFKDEVKDYKVSGDVKYHYGCFSKFNINGKTIKLNLSFNPSHLEIVSPVVMGIARGYMDRFKKRSEEILPITIHGDASVVGQGIVQETINLYKIDGYSVGGTIRIVLNNQIGFTISKERFLRSSRYCTDIFKFTQFPIFHVNADDIEAVMFSSRIALDFREKFRKDVVVELIGYRRRGHSEIDDPKVTQPVMYHIIEQHETSRSIYSKSLIKNDIITHEDVEDMIGSYRRKLKENSFSSYGINFINDVEHPTDFKNLKIRSNSIIGVKNLQKTLQEIISVPKNFMLHPMVDKILQNRSRIATKESLCDWATSEILAYSTLLQRGFDVRISGEDVSRGTFFQRNFRIYDQIDGKEYFSIEKISNCIGTINVWDSVLSEESTLAFEYGYSLIHNGSLTVWEAQFGDFSNVAQVVIDQFISSGNKKWGIESNLVIFLPHGYEGQGPDHSSARVERYLQLCAEKNMKIFVPSDPSQIYHALLEHCCIDRDQRCPLIVFSPKSLLRHPDCLVGLKELACGRFRKVIGEDEKYSISEKIQRVILCCGKIYYELLEERNVSIKKINKTIAIIRIEQLYPFPNEELKQEIQKYPCVVDFIWCQEEPKNQGAWNYIKEYIKKVIPSYANLSYFGRSELSTSVEGDRVRYRLKQKHIVQSALTG